MHFTFSLWHLLTGGLCPAFRARPSVSSVRTAPPPERNWSAFFETAKPSRPEGMFSGGLTCCSEVSLGDCFMKLTTVCASMLITGFVLPQRHRLPHIMLYRT